MMEKLMRKTAPIGLLVIIFILCACTTFAQEGKPKYVGVGKCKLCHLKAHKQWETTEHAKAFESLKSGEAKKLSTNPVEDSKCLKCHTTGFGEPGGYDIAAKDAALEGVQCESCHGAGEKYKDLKVMKDKELSIKNGLVVPTEETCKKCHNEDSPTFDKAKWNFKEVFEKVKHTK